jgi:excisionase family DNA binding protein
VTKRPTGRVVATVVATGDRIWPDPNARSDVRSRHGFHLQVVSPARGEPRRRVDAMTTSTGIGTTPDTDRPTAVTPTPAGVVRALAARLDGVERELSAARDALSAVETALLAVHRGADVQRDALTTEQVAHLLGLSRSTVTAMIGRHKIRSVKIGNARRVLRRDLDGYLAGLSSGGAA